MYPNYYICKKFLEHIEYAETYGPDHESRCFQTELFYLTAWDDYVLLELRDQERTCHDWTSENGTLESWLELHILNT